MRRRAAPKHRTPRRERVERQARREALGPDVSSTDASSRAVPMGVSSTGLIGGVMGFVVLVALAISVALGAGDASRWWAIPLGALGLVFVPAIWVSARPVPSRERILKGVVVVTLVLAIAGAPAYGLELPIVLSPPIGLLAQAAGFIFQGSGSNRR